MHFSQYFLRFRRKDGRHLGVLTGNNAGDGFLKIACRMVLDDVGFIAFQISGKHKLMEEFQNASDLEVELWYRNRFIFRAFVEDVSDPTDDEGKNIAQVICPGENSLLTRYVCAYPSGTTDRTQFTARSVAGIAEDIVRFNGGQHTNDDVGRLGTVPEMLINVPAIEDSGPVVDWTSFGKQVLTTLQELTQAHGGNFRLTRASHRLWNFEFAYPYLGRDLRNQKGGLFSLERNNITKPSLNRHRIGRKSRAFVGGQETGALRQFVVVDQECDIYAEMFVDGRNAKSEESLMAVGRAHLREARDHTEFGFRITAPGEIMLGDLIKGRYKNTTRSHQVTALEIECSRDGDFVTAESEEWYGEE
jgi:hypothetical protein